MGRGRGRGRGGARCADANVLLRHRRGARSRGRAHPRFHLQGGGYAERRRRAVVLAHGRGGLAAARVARSGVSGASVRPTRELCVCRASHGGAPLAPLRARAANWRWRVCLPRRRPNGGITPCGHVSGLVRCGLVLAGVWHAVRRRSRDRADRRVPARHARDRGACAGGYGRHGPR